MKNIIKNMSSYHNYFNNPNYIDKGSKNRPKEGLDYNYLKSNDSNEEKKPKNRKLSDFYNQKMDNNNREKDVMYKKIKKREII